VAADVKAGWDELLGGYLERRRALHGVILVMDCRHPLTDFDQVLLDFCRAARRPVHVLLSKSDKLSQSERLKTLRAVRQALAAQSASFSVQLFSAQNKEGVDAARTMVGEWLALTGSAGKKNPGNKGKDSGAYK
jgi:GTP-binding protein